MAISADRERLLRSYAAGDVSWTSLRGQGIDNCRDVLAGLDELGLRPPLRLDVEAALFCVKL